ncbi:MAG: DUF4124 domain-containing protein [Methylophilaceae bacterium]
MRFCIAILLLTIMSASANAEVYKWKDKDGTVRYSDVPPSGTTQYEPLKTKKPANGAVAPSAVAGDTKSAGIKADDKSKPVDADGKTAEKKDSQLKAKQKACANAKDNLQKLKQGGIIYKENAKGEREYLDETSMKAETANAEKEVTLACN